ncbi:MAG: hypothetical protein KJ734_10265, partial [Chloroflexi bacterium]|nr:hypothetical protein [Chloroflexota bacterium]
MSTSSLDESRATDATSTPQPRWPLRISLLVVLALFWLPLAFLVAIGWPTAAPPTADPGTRLIVPPSPPGGLPLDLIRWLIVFGGLGLGLALGLALTVWLFGQARRAGVELPGWRFTLLAVAGLLSLLVYALNLVLPFPLEPYYGMVVVCMNRIAEQDAGVALATTAAIVALFLLYALAYRLCRAQHGRRLWAIVLIGAVLLALLNLFVIPTSSTDVYDNLVRGRIADVYHGNTYVYTPVDYAWEPFAEYISWDDTTSAYGPLWEMLSAFISHVAGDHLWPNVLGHKLLALGSYLVSVALVAAILRRIAPDRALAGTLLWAWNPLILIEGVANAHNDMVMVALILGAFWFLNLSAGRAGHTGPRDWLYNGIALLLLTAGVLVKFVPALFLPFVILYLLLPEPSWRRRIGLGLLLLIPAAL